MTDDARALYYATRQYSTAYDVHLERQQHTSDKREREFEAAAVAWLKRALRVETTDPEPPVVFS